MFTVKIGPAQYDVESPLLEQMARDAAEAKAVAAAAEKASIATRVFAELANLKADRILEAVRPAPRLEFIFGPVSEQE